MKCQFTPFPLHYKTSALSAKHSGRTSFLPLPIIPDFISSNTIPHLHYTSDTTEPNHDDGHKQIFGPDGLPKVS